MNHPETILFPAKPSESLKQTCDKMSHTETMR